MLRVFENQGKASTAKIRVGAFRQAWLSNLNEEMLEPLEVTERCVTVKVGDYKVISIKLA